MLALPFDAGFSRYNLERLRAAETMLLGRTPFDGFRQYWPGVADDETQDEVEREISRRNGAITKVVGARRLRAGPGPVRTGMNVPQATRVAFSR